MEHQKLLNLLNDANLRQQNGPLITQKQVMV